MNYSIKWCSIPPFMTLWRYSISYNIYPLCGYIRLADILLNGRPILHLQVYFDGYYRMIYKILRS